MMNGPEKSDSAMRAMKPANKVGEPTAEWVEQRAGTKGNAGQPHTRRTQSRGSVSQGLDRVRQAARQSLLPRLNQTLVIVLRSHQRRSQRKFLSTCHVRHAGHARQYARYVGWQGACPIKYRRRADAEPHLRGPS
jgi:hypothetical protein